MLLVFGRFSKVILKMRGIWEVGGVELVLFVDSFVRGGYWLVLGNCLDMLWF